MRSSYIENNYDEVFASILTAYKPLLAVELGVLDGYSTLAIGKALKKNNLAGSHLYAYDLFEDYPYKHGNKEAVEEEIVLVKDFVTLEKADAFTVHEKYKDDIVWFLHVDLSNDGDIVKRILEAWTPKLVIGAVVLFEGGTEERDNVEWMKKYNKKPMKPEIESNDIILHNYIFGTYSKFPGLTMLIKKWYHKEGYK